MWSQYTINQVDSAVYQGNHEVFYDVDNDGFDDLSFYIGGWPIDSYVMLGIDQNDSIHFSYCALNTNSFNFTVSNDSIGWIAETYILTPDNLNSFPGGMNVVKYIGYYKKLTAIDSVFGYFTIMPYLGNIPNSAYGDTLFIFNHVQAATVNTPLIAGQACDFKLNIDHDTPCVTGCSGSIEAESLGGIPPFTYSWSNGESTGVIDSLCIGQYNVTITDFTGCTWTDSAQIDTVNGMDILFTYYGNGGCNSAVQALVSGGVGPYTYSWSNGGNSDQISSLCQGWYVLTVIDCTGCDFIDSVYVPADTALVSTPGLYQGPNGACGLDTCAGIVYVSIYNGTPPYTIQASNGFNTVINNNSFLLENLCEGYISWTITDDNGDSTLNSYYVYSANNLPFEVSVDYNSGPTCPGCNDGILWVNAQNGNPPFLFSLDNGVTWQTNNYFTDLTAGTYQICIQDANGCEDCITDSLVDCSAMSSNAPYMVSDATCISCADGEISVTAAIFGCSPVYYTIDGGITFQVNGYFPGLNPGNYTVHYFCDLGGCWDSISVSINSIVCDGKTEAIISDTCGNCTGSIEVILTTSPMVNPQYLWSTGDTTESISGLCGGIYTLSITDNVTLCAVQETYYINDYQSLTSFSGITEFSSCYQGCNGSVELDISTGVAPYNIDASSGYLTQQTVDHYTLINLCAGDVIIEVTDTFGCTVIDTFFVDQPTPLQLTYEQVDTGYCQICENTSATVNISGGIPPYNLAANVGGVLQLGSNLFTIDSLCASDIVVTVTDSNSCYSIQSYPVYHPVDSLYFTQMQTALASCFTCSDGIIQLNVYGGNPPYTVDWSDLGSTSDSLIAVDLNGGSGFVCVMDINGCEYCDSVTVDFIDNSGIEENLMVIQLYPNPAKDEIVIHSSAPIEQVVLLDNQGKEVLVVNGNHQSILDIGLSDLCSGSYFVKLLSEEYVSIKKLIIQK